MRRFMAMHRHQFCSPPFSPPSPCSALPSAQQRHFCRSLPMQRTCITAPRRVSSPYTVKQKFERQSLITKECVAGRPPKVSSSTLNVICQASSNFAHNRASDLMLVSDLDFTMVDHNEPSHSSLLRFTSLWEAEYAQKSLLVYSTGRSPEKYAEICKQVPLLTPDIAILSVGTEIRYGNSLEADSGWENYLNHGWNREIIVQEAQSFSTLTFQDKSEQRPHKVSFKVERKDAEQVISNLSSKLKAHGLKVKLIYSGSIDLDVLPERAGKGAALAYILKKAEAENWVPNNVLVCGDSGNDLELFTVEGVNGVIVGNAHEELVQWFNTQSTKTNTYLASHRCAGGIIEALEHFSLGPHISPRDSVGQCGSLWQFPDDKNIALKSASSPQREVVEFGVFLEKWLLGELPNDAATFKRLESVIANKSSMVCHSGVERSLYESVCMAKSKHGSMVGKNFLTWTDSIKEYTLAEGVYLVTWQSWEQSSEVGRKGSYVTAILLAKDGRPNGVEWFRIHETSRRDY